MVIGEMNRNGEIHIVLCHNNQQLKLDALVKLDISMNT